jgi:hypothetical protein
MWTGTRTLLLIWSYLLVGRRFFNLWWKLITRNLGSMTLLKARDKGLLSTFSGRLALVRKYSFSSNSDESHYYGSVITGKTFSAEATSEHVKRPLYVVGAGDLGTKAIDLDHALERVFDVATIWKAIVLIDEVSLLDHFVVEGLNSSTGGCLPRTTLQPRSRAQCYGRSLVSTQRSIIW